MDRYSKETRSYTMSRIKSKNTGLERVFFDLLEAQDIAYSPHPDLYGRPDCLIEPRLIIFVDSDFWHGWQLERWKHKLSTDYWLPKIKGNVNRDKKKFRRLRNDGYIVVRVWEHTLRKNPGYVSRRIKKLMTA